MSHSCLCALPRLKGKMSKCPFDSGSLSHVVSAPVFEVEMTNSATLVKENGEYGACIQCCSLKNSSLADTCTRHRKNKTRVRLCFCPSDTHRHLHRSAKKEPSCPQILALLVLGPLDSDWTTTPTLPGLQPTRGRQ